MDGKHCENAPAKSGSYYFNYKRSINIALLTVVDAVNRFIYVDVGCIEKYLMEGFFTIVRFMRHLKGTNWMIHTSTRLYICSVCDRCQRIYDCRQSRARRINVNSLCILATRFRISMQPIALHPSKVQSIVLVCVSLHDVPLTRIAARAVYTQPGSCGYSSQFTD